MGAALRRSSRLNGRSTLGGGSADVGDNEEDPCDQQNGGFSRSKFGLFGFQDAWSAPFAQQAFFIEVAATGALILAGTLCLMKQAERGPTGSTRSGLPVLM
jgi:hypothetical protein